MNYVVMGGGPSPEFGVSCQTARYVAQILQAHGASVDALVVLPDGRLVEDSRQEIPVVPMHIDRSVELEACERFRIHAVDRLLERRGAMVFDMFHGGPGYDGRFQLNIEQCGCMVASGRPTALWLFSSKQRTKELLAANGLRVPTGILLSEGDVCRLDGVFPLLGAISECDVILKPDRGGSSIGVRRADRLNLQAFQASLESDDAVVVEEFVRGEEFSCGVFQTLSGPKFLPPVYRGSTKNAGVYDFSAKYSSSRGKKTVADLNDVELTRLALKVEGLMEKLASLSSGLNYMRMDCVVPDTGGEPQVLEINAIPALYSGGSFESGLARLGVKMHDFLATVAAVAASSTQLRRR